MTIDDPTLARPGTRVLYHRIGGELPGSPAVERVNPARSGDVVAVTPDGDADTVDAAVEAARRAQPAWAAMTAPARGAILLRAAAVLASRQEDVAVDLVREEGKTLAEATGEVGRAIEILQYYGGEGRRGRGEIVPSGTPHTLAYTRREPLGVVGIITPWNFPIAIPTWKSAPALVSGNAVVLKPATLTPLSVWHLATVLAEAGLPDGVLNVVYGPGSVIGDAIARHPGLAAVSFTGSNAVGRGIEELVTARRARVQLELGGKNPLVVLDDAEPALAARIAAESGFGATGQTCTATSRVICTPGIHDALVEALVAEAAAYRPGDGILPGTKMGPVVSGAQLRSDLEWIGRGADEGGTLVTPPVEHSEQFLTPAVFTDILPSHGIAQEEVFGPVVSVMRADDPDHAIALANDIPFGLSAGVITNDMRMARRFIDSVQAGIVKVNRPTSGVDPNVPFGGVKESSTNTYREQGAAATDFYTWTKSVYFGLDQ
ncbi:MAG TPA: aldehyde dehydrogenase family protein [Pseudonocardiaceae bacterium]|jgi:aldehyde dehydrogenase (NAD+)|nr:aldehyde dehydrogenase family protein [Pseudonocardiaceae bacterium]